MNSQPIRVLVVEDNPDDAFMLRRSLLDSMPVFDIECVGRLNAAMARLDAGGIDAVMLDLSLPDSQGLEGLFKIQNQAPRVPVVILTGMEDEGLAEKAISGGAQDYLVKSRVKGNSVARVIRYAIDRSKLLEEQRTLSLIDELTGLYNRRGFIILSHQHLRVARRTGRGAALFFGDVDRLKLINDTFGHKEGDKALIEIARVLKKTFRETDVLSRIGGDEFTVLVTGMEPESAKNIVSQLHERLKACNQNLGYNMSLTMDIAHFDPDHPSSIHDLLDRADQLMYRQKQMRK